jgi:hypothetical protein
MPSRARTGVSRGWAIHRPVTLLRVFLLASAVILISGGLLLGSVLTAALRGQALDETRASMTQYVDGVLRPELVRGDRVHISPHLSGKIQEQLRRERDIVSVKVWRPDGVLVWANLATQRIGRRFTLEGELGETTGDNKAHASISNLDDEENAAEGAALRNRRAFEVYAPVQSDNGTRAIGAYEIYASPKQVEAFIASRKRLIWFAILGVFLALYGALALLVRNASSMLRRQATTLHERSREADGLIPPSRGELARGDREPERDGRRERSVHGRPFPRACSGSRSRLPRSSASPRSASTRCASAGSSTTSGRSPCRTAS